MSYTAVDVVAIPVNVFFKGFVFWYKYPVNVNQVLQRKCVFMKFSFNFISIHDWDIPNVRQKLRMDGTCFNFPFILFSSMTETFLMSDKNYT